MARIESSIQASKSIEEVFAFLNTAENHAKFIPNMVEFKQTSAGAFGQVGATAQGVLRILGRKIDVLYEIIEYETNRRLAMKGVLGPIAFKDGYVLSPANEGTQIHFWLELSPTGYAKLLRPFAGLISNIHAHETLANLEKVLKTNA